MEQHVKLHYELTRVGASLHRDGCPHGNRRGHVSVVDVMDARDPIVRDLIERGYRVTIAPCLKESK